MKKWSELSWYDMIRHFTNGVFRIRDPWNEDGSSTVAADKRDYLSRSQCGTVVGLLGIEDGVHWRFDIEDTLGVRFLVKDGIIIEKQTAFKTPEGVTRVTERADGRTEEREFY